MTAVAQKVRTYISKEGDKIAEKKIELDKLDKAIQEQ